MSSEHGSGFSVELLSTLRGRLLGEPVALLTLRPSELRCLGMTLLFNQQQCCRIRDTLDTFLNDPQSWLYMPLEEQVECFIEDEEFQSRSES